MPRLAHCVLLGLLAVACLANSAVAQDAADSTSSPSEVKPFQPGDSFPAEGLPTDWIRGKPITSLEKGVTYVFVLWNTVGGHKFAPGYNIRQTVNPFADQPNLRPAVLWVSDSISRQKLQTRLSYPSQQTPFPIADATTNDGPTVRLWIDRFQTTGKRNANNTIVVRDGRVLWIGQASDLTSSNLANFLVPDFDFDRYTKEDQRRKLREKELLIKLMQGYNEAVKNGDKKLAEAILNEVEAEPDLHPFLYQQLRTIRCFENVERKDYDAALAEMRKLGEKYPNDKGSWSWIHKIVSGTPELRKPGLSLQAEAAFRVGQLSENEMASAWFQAAASHWQELGNDAQELIALEAAEKCSGPARRLDSYRKASEPK